MPLRLHPLSLPRLPIMARMVPPITITADEVNCLIHAYFEDSGEWPRLYALRL